MWRRPQTNKKLTPIRPWSTIRHTQYPLPRMPQLRMEFIFKLPTIPSIDTLSSCSGAGGVAALDHEVADYAWGCVSQMWIWSAERGGEGGEGWENGEEGREWDVRWKITLSYLWVEARVAKFFVVWGEEEG